MSISRSVASPVARSVSAPIAGGGGGGGAASALVLAAS